MKRIYRIINRVNNHAEGDYIALDAEEPGKEERLKMFHPVHTYISKFVTNFEACELHKDIFVNGKRTYELPSILDIQKYNEQSLALFWEEYMRTLNPEEYPVDLSQECWDHKMNYIQTVREQVEKTYKNKQRSCPFSVFQYYMYLLGKYIKIRRQIYFICKF